MLWNRIDEIAKVDPWRELLRMTDDFGDFFSFGRQNFATTYPHVNIWAKNEEAVVEVEVPGIDPEKLDISVHERMLSIKGTRKEQDLDDGEKYLRKECPSGEFMRKISLPFAIESDNVNAVYEAGILKIHLPRAEADKPRQIAVKTA